MVWLMPCPKSLLRRRADYYRSLVRLGCMKEKQCPASQAPLRERHLVLSAHQLAISSEKMLTLEKSRAGPTDGTVIAITSSDKIGRVTIRVIGSGSETAVSEGFGGGVLSLQRQAAALSGERGCCWS